MIADFDLAVVVSTGAVHIRCRGDIDIVSAPRLEQALQQAIDRRPGLLAVDLSSVSFLGSDGLRVLASAEDRATSLGVAMVVHSSAVVRRVLDVSGLAGRLGVS